jgi:hypothetical protein
MAVLCGLLMLAYPEQRLVARELSFTRGVRDLGAYEERALENAYNVGAEITMSREPAYGVKATKNRYSREFCAE